MRFFFFKLIKKKSYLFLVALGLCCSAWVSQVAVRGLLIAMDPLVAEHRL